MFNKDSERAYNFIMNQFLLCYGHVIVLRELQYLFSITGPYT